MWITQMVTGGFLGWMSIQDVRTRKIPWLWLLPGVGLVLCSIWLIPALPLWQRGMGAILGAVMLGISWGTRQAVGFADSILILILGLTFGGAFCVPILFLGFGLAAIYSMGLLIFRRAGRKTKIPFLPFLFAAFCIMSCCHG